MKKLLIAIILIAEVTFTAYTQQTTASKIPVDSVTKKITYVDVVQQTGTKDTLYNRAIHWCNSFFANPQSATTLRDVAMGKIEGKYQFKVTNKPDKDGLKTDAGIVKYSFTIELKENKYRIKITDLNLKGASYFALERWLDKTDKAYVPQWDYYLIQVDEYMKDFIKSLKKGMQEVKKVNDNW